MVRVEDAVKVYRLGGEDIYALNGVSFDVGRGDFISIVGPSGCGKSTLMNVIGALDGLDNGKIYVNEEDISEYNDSRQAWYRRKHVGFIFQTFNLQRHLTAVENVELPLVFDGQDAKRRREKALSALGTVKLSDRIRHRPSELSGGQQQRVAIARAIVNEPQLLLADEPTGNLDSKTGRDILDLLRRLNQEKNMTIIMVTHSLKQASDSGCVMSMLDGKIVKVECRSK